MTSVKINRSPTVNEMDNIYKLLVLTNEVAIGIRMCCCRYWVAIDLFCFLYRLKRISSYHPSMPTFFFLIHFFLSHFFYLFLFISYKRISHNNSLFSGNVYHLNIHPINLLFCLDAVSPLSLWYCNDLRSSGIILLLYMLILNSNKRG